MGKSDVEKEGRKRIKSLKSIYSRYNNIHLRTQPRLNKFFIKPLRCEHGNNLSHTLKSVI